MSKTLCLLNKLAFKLLRLSLKMLRPSKLIVESATKDPLPMLMKFVARLVSAGSLLPKV